jgi:putative CocE/NonD family hydrolase
MNGLVRQPVLTTVYIFPKLMRSVMKIPGCVVLLLVLVCSAFGQNLYFPKASFSDSATLAKSLPSLAKRLIEEYREADSTTYYDNLIRLQIIAGEYSKVETSVDAFARLSEPDTTWRKEVGFHYRVFARTMSMLKQNRGDSFAQIYGEVFTQLYRSLPDLTVEEVEWGYFGYDLTPVRKSLADRIAKQKSAAGDSIAPKDAMALCRNFCTLVTHDRSRATATKLLKAFEHEKYVIDDSVLLTMPGGATVSLTVARKRNVILPQPVALMYNIYSGPDHWIAKESAARGYVGVVANTRGKRLSRNEVEPYEHDGEDAYTIIDWISKQSWCNDSVGMYGGSYLGFAQWSTAKHLHPALKTIVPLVSVGAGIDFPQQNGIFGTYCLSWIHYVTDTKNPVRQNEQKWDSVFAAWYRSGRSFRALDSLEGRPNAIFQRWLDHPSYDEYWQHMTPQQEEFAKINIPVLTISGYWDDDQLGALYYYKQHHQWNKNPNHYLLMGPYDHGGAQGNPQENLYGYQIDSVAHVFISEVVYQWLDHVLKHANLPPILSDKVNFEVMGANEWRHVSSINKMCNDTLTLYLSNTSGESGYKLVPSKPETAGYIVQTVDLKDRRTIVPKGHAIDAFEFLVDTVLHTGTQLTFVSDPVQEATTIAGSFTASILAAINKKDFDIVIDLYEQRPDGKYFALNDNIQRASYAKDRSTRHLLQPNKVENIQLNNTFLTCVQLPKGSRIIALVGVNNHPQWQINYGSGKDVSEESIADAHEPLKVKWYNTSTIKIPIMK